MLSSPITRSLFVCVLTIDAFIIAAVVLILGLVPILTGVLRLSAPQSPSDLQDRFTNIFNVVSLPKYVAPLYTAFLGPRIHNFRADSNVAIRQPLFNSHIRVILCFI